MKNFRFIAACTAVLFLLGSFFGFILTDIVKNILDIEFVSIYGWEGFISHGSLGLLMAFCSVCAWAISWAYAKARNQDFSRGIYLAGLAGSIAIAGASIFLRLLWFDTFIRSHTVLPAIPYLAYRFINYFHWGVWPVFWLFGLSSIVLLWIARQRKQRALAEST